MTSNLTEADVTRLLNDPSAEVRAETAAKIAHKFDRAELNEAERRIAIDIFRIMTRDAARRGDAAGAARAGREPAGPART